MSNKYLIDANVFIQAKSFYYRFEFCRGFWDWLLIAHNAGLVFSIQKVKDELMQGNDGDLVKQWVQELPESFFVPDSKDVNVMHRYSDVMNWAVANEQYSESAKQEFAKAKVADAFLIATAMQHKYKIVTHEKSSPDAKKRIPIPDAAKSLGIKTIMMYDLLTKYAESTFVLKVV